MTTLQDHQEQLRELFKRRKENVNGASDETPPNTPQFQTEVSLPNSPSAILRKWNCLLIGYPSLIYDYHNITFQTDQPVPRNAQFHMGGKPTVILFHSHYESLPLAYGTIPALEKRLKGWALIRSLWKKEREQISDVRFLTLDFLYEGVAITPQNMKAQFSEGTKDFIEGVGGGQLWHNPEDMTPWQLGKHLTLAGLKRQQRKGRHLELAKTLDSTVKWMFAALLIAIVFTVIMVVSS